MSVWISTCICSEARKIDDFNSTFHIQGKCKHIFASSINCDFLLMLWTHERNSTETYVFSWQWRREHTWNFQTHATISVGRITKSIPPSISPSFTSLQISILRPSFLPSLSWYSSHWHKTEEPSALSPHRLRRQRTCRICPRPLRLQGALDQIEIWKLRNGQKYTTEIGKNKVWFKGPRNQNASGSCGLASLARPLNATVFK